MRRLLLLALFVFSITTLTAQENAIEAELLFSIPFEPERDILNRYHLLEWSPDGRYLVTGSPAETLIQLWDTENGEEVARFEFVDFRTITSFAFSTDGSLLAVSGLSIAIIDVEQWVGVGNDTPVNAREFVVSALIVDRQTIIPDILDMAFTPDSQALVVATRDAENLQHNDFVLYDVRERGLPVSNPPQIAVTIPEHISLQGANLVTDDAGVRALGVNVQDDSNFVAVLRIEVDIEANTANLRSVSNQLVTDGRIVEAKLVDGGNHIQVSSQQGIEFYSIADDGITLMRNELSDRMYPNILLSPNGTIVATTDTILEVDFYASQTVEQVGSLTVDEPLSRRALYFSPDGQKIAVVTFQNKVEIFALSGELVQSDLELASSPATVPIIALDCEVDLSESVALLVQAQAASSSGDYATASALIEQVREQLDNLSCDEVVEGIPLIAEPVVFEFEAGEFSFAYPDGWVTDDFQESVFIVANNLETLSIDFNQASPPPFSTGNAVLLMGIDESDSNASALLIEVIPFGEDFGQVTEQMEFRLGDKTVAQAVIKSDDFELLLVVADLGGIGERPFAQMFFLTAPDEVEALKAIAVQILETIQVEN